MLGFHKDESGAFIMKGLNTTAKHTAPAKKQAAYWGSNLAEAECE